MLSMNKILSAIKVFFLETRARINGVPYAARRIYKYREKGIRIGDGTLFYNDVYITRLPGANVTIGKNCLLSGCSLYTYDSTIGIVLGTKEQFIDSITIGDNCFLGFNSIILRGVTIGDNVIVGAGAVVTKDIPSGMVAVGNPAKCICTVEELAEKQRAKQKEVSKRNELD